jgi:hypothetical protein
VWAADVRGSASKNKRQGKKSGISKQQIFLEVGDGDKPGEASPVGTERRDSTRSHPPPLTATPSPPHASCIGCASPGWSPPPASAVPRPMEAGDVPIAAANPGQVRIDSTFSLLLSGQRLSKLRLFLANFMLSVASGICRVVLTPIFSFLVY